MSLPRQASILNYGGVPVLVDELPLVNPESELSADNLNQLRNDTAAMTATVPIMICQFMGSATLPTITITPTWSPGWSSVWGNVFTYQPIFTRVSQGLINIQLSALVPDFIGGSNLVNMRKICIAANSIGQAFTFATSVTSASTGQIQIMNATGTPVDASGFLFTMEIF